MWLGISRGQGIFLLILALVCRLQSNLSSDVMFLVPWVPETFHARFLVSVNRSSAEDLSVDTEASRRPREKILRFSGYLSCALKVESSASWAATIFVTNVVTLTISFFSLSSRISLPDLPQSFSMFQNNTWCVCLCRWGRGQFRYS